LPHEASLLFMNWTVVLLFVLILFKSNWGFGFCPTRQVYYVLYCSPFCFERQCFKVNLRNFFADCKPDVYQNQNFCLGLGKMRSNKDESEKEMYFYRFSQESSWTYWSIKLTFLFGISFDIVTVYKPALVQPFVAYIYKFKRCVLELTISYSFQKLTGNGVTGLHGVLVQPRVVLSPVQRRGLVTVTTQHQRISVSTVSALEQRAFPAQDHPIHVQVCTIQNCFRKLAYCIET
jgi:hypothetical protein